MRTFLLIVIILSIVVLTGCTTCPESCDDGNKCTEDFCSEQTNFTCVNKIITPCDGNKICEVGEFLVSTDCPTCDDSNPCTNDSYSFDNNTCIHIEFAPCVGNDICEEGEYPSIDCPDCDDKNKCTKDTYNFKTEKCENNIIKPCDGNDICETGEYGKSSDCPDCDDHNKCTRDSYDYSLKKCINKDITPCCGNDICERTEGESHSSCSADCDMTKDEAVNFCVGSKDSDLLINMCLEDYAVELQDVNICNEIHTEFNRDNCITEVAKALKDEDICRDSSDDFSEKSCIGEVAEAKGDYSLCTQANSKGLCFERVFEALGSNSHNHEVCEGVSGVDKKTCLAWVYHDNSYCDDLDSIDQIYCKWRYTGGCVTIDVYPYVIC